jgi:hypothetical protein
VRLLLPEELSQYLSIHRSKHAALGAFNRHCSAHLSCRASTGAGAIPDFLSHMTAPEVLIYDYAHNCLGGFFFLLLLLLLLLSDRSGITDSRSEDVKCER